MGKGTGIPFAVRFAGGGEYRNSDQPPAFTLVIRSERAYCAHRGVRPRRPARVLLRRRDRHRGQPGQGAGGGPGKRHRPATSLLVRPAQPLARARATPTATGRRRSSNAEFHYALGTGVLPPLARRPADALHLRVLEGRHAHARGGAAQQDRPRGAQAAAQAGRGGGRHRQRLRRLHVPRAGAATASRSPASTPPSSQVEHGARARSRAAAWATRSQVVDTRLPRRAPRSYDKVVSIGCLEHAGRDQLDEVIRAHAALPQARRPRPAALHRPRRPLRDRVLHPQVRVPRRLDPEPRATSIAAMERAGLEVLDIENLRRHYALTLDAWAERFERNWEQDPRARPAALRRALPAHLARVPVRLRRDVPLARRATRTCSRSCSPRATSRGRATR